MVPRTGRHPIIRLFAPSATFGISMALNVGSRLGHYDVTALIGEEAYPDATRTPEPFYLVLAH